MTIFRIICLSHPKSYKLSEPFSPPIIMSDFDTLCTKLEQMDPATFTQLFNELSVDVDLVAFHLQVVQLVGVYDALVKR